jgi:hypothetical protein
MKIEMRISQMSYQIAEKQKEAEICEKRKEEVTIMKGGQILW